MSKCPICETEYIEGTVDNCSVCDWNLKPCSFSATGEEWQAYAEKEQAYIQWARQMWQKYLVQRDRLSMQPPDLIPVQKSSHHQSDRHQNYPPQSVDRSLFFKLEARLNELEYRCKKAETEIEQLRADLTAAQEQNSHLTSQMEWVVYVLQEANPQEMQQTLWQLQDWANSLENSQPQNYLHSEIGIDYSKLEKLLAAGKWREGDRCTWEIMLRGTNREERGFIPPEDLDLFPDTDLGTIAWLWEHYSSGRFGFKIQKYIWDSVDKDYTSFCDRVGWRVKDSWLYYDELNCSLEAQEGHLPVIGWRKRSCYGVGRATAQENFAALISRFTESNAMTL